MSELQTRIQEDMKNAMRAKDKPRLGAIRLMLAAFKQKEVDERIELTDQHVLAILDKLSKQRRESITQFEQAQREDLADKERFELGIIQEYLPEQLSEAEVEQLIAEAISSSGAGSIKDMGKVMGILKPKLQGRADMSQVSTKIKEKLA